MFDDLHNESNETQKVLVEARTIASGAMELAADTWDELAEFDQATHIVEGANKLADRAWDAASTIKEVNPGAYIEDGARNTAYVGGRAVLGAGKLVESAVKAIGTVGAYVLGNDESAVSVAQTGIMDDLADTLGDTLEVSDEVKAAGDKAEIVGEIAGGIGLSLAAAALAPETMAVAAGAGVDAVFALGAAGETLEAMSEDGKLSDKDMVIAGGAAVGSAVASAVINKVSGKVISHFANEAASAAAGEVDDIAQALSDSTNDMVRAVSESADEVVGVLSDNADDVAKAAARNVDEAVEPIVSSGDDVVRAVTNETDDVTKSLAAETDDVTKAVVKESDTAGGTVEHMICRNESLADDVHPMSGVLFEQRTIYLEDGRVIEGVFPKFESAFDAKIPKELYEASNTSQFKECNKQFMKALEENPELKAKCSAEFLEQLADGCSTGIAPDGYVWHHDAAEGVIQLVDRVTHEITGHTGGRAVWGGGY